MKYLSSFICFLILAIFPNKSMATITTTINVTQTYCTSIGSGMDQNCINTAINSLSVSGGVVFFPCAIFTTNGPIIIPSGNIQLQGSGKCTIIRGSGNFNTVTEHGPSPTGSGTNDYYGTSITDITFDESSKTGGYTLDLANVAQMILRNLYINFPWCGPHIHNFNDVLVENVIIYNAIGNSRGIGCQAFLLTGGGTADPFGRSDVIAFKDFVISGNSIQDRTGGHHGLIVDGFVNTVSGDKLYLTAVDGNGLWFRNSIGASQIPQFATFYGLEADFPYNNAIQVQFGSVLHFTDTLVNGSLTTHNIYLASGVSRVSFQGGFTSNAALGGIDSSASQLTVANMDIYCNSSPPGGGVAGAWAGLTIESSSRLVAVTGNKIGCQSNPTWQKYGIVANAGADQYTVTTNTLEYNSLGGFSGASGTASKIVANNAQ